MQDAENQPTQMNPNAMYREEVFTDRRIGVIKRLTPVTASGEIDTSRDIIYSGETQIMLGNNPLPISFELEAQNLGEAAEKFSDAAQEAAQDTVKRLEEMRRDMASQIVVPGQGGGVPGGGGMGGMGGGGKIQIP